MKKYSFKPYNILFPSLFEIEKRRISCRIKINAKIEHIGSTAIPHLGGKGIIDIAIGVSKEDFDIASEQIQTLGYELRKVWSTPDRYFFRQDLPDPEQDTRRYHIHLMIFESNDWQEMIFFRDYLRNHPAEAREYGELKKKAAEEVNEDGVKYREMKDPFFKKILKRKNEI